MNGVWKFLKSRWRRPKHKGVSGNFSTIVIITGIVIGGWILTGGEYPNVYPTYTSTPVEGQPLSDQPKHPKRFTLTFHELRFKPRADTPETETPDACDKTALIFLVDISTSMIQPPSKLGNFKSALESFVETLPSDALFGLYTFSSPNGQPWPSVGIGPLSNVRSQIVPALNRISPPGNAATHMRDGFAAVQGPLAAAQANPAYQGYKFNLVFISDGVPENENECVEEFTIGGCDEENNGRNYDRRHDPTDISLGQPDIPDQIKASGVNIYSIVIYNTTDAQVFPELRTLMQRISSGSQYYSESAGGGTLNTIYNQIKASAC